MRGTPQRHPLAQTTVSASGTLEVPLQISETLGGRHAVPLVSNEKVVSEIPYQIAD